VASGVGKFPGFPPNESQGRNRTGYRLLPKHIPILLQELSLHVLLIPYLFPFLFPLIVIRFFSIFKLY
jgi:hypothetical protein